jgi:hypothetical protein
MQDQRSGACAGLAGECVERVVLALLLEPGCRGPWSVAELGREIGSEPLAAEAVVGLHAAGLVQRAHDFVWPSRSAARFHELAVAEWPDP